MHVILTPKEDVCIFLSITCTHSALTISTMAWQWCQRNDGQRWRACRLKYIWWGMHDAPQTPPNGPMLERFWLMLAGVPEFSSCQARVLVWWCSSHFVLQESSFYNAGVIWKFSSGDMEVPSCLHSNDVFSRSSSVQQRNWKNNEWSTGIYRCILFYHRCSIIHGI